MRIYFQVLFLVIFTLLYPGCKKDIISITDFGAVNDSVTNNQDAIQKAIDYVSDRGGGQVEIPAGNYYTGAFLLKSNTSLYLSSGGKAYCKPGFCGLCY